ncbi:MAG: dihydrolipoyllysine-residue acetyltransferase [Gammaproteobacteria bacterium]|nr:dihydrolipoyllysine-residue acetyltransferase [Gammaproteobacteria bacterium]
MADSIEIIVPDLGDFDNVEIIEVLVGAGDKVAREDGLITLETDKASFDVPAPHDGEIESLTVTTGDKVSTGDVIGRMRVTGAVESSESPAATDTPTESVADTVAVASPIAAARASAAKQTLAVPDIGDFDDVDVIEVHVSAGDSVDVEDPLVTLETDKAAMDVPAVVAGTVDSVMVSVGDKVSEGTPLVVVNAVAAEPQAAADSAPAATPGKASPAMPPAEKPAPAAAATQPAAPKTLPAIDESGFSKAHASPSVRKLARELGVNLVQVRGSGLKQRILHDDVKAFVKAILTGERAPEGGGLPKTPRVDFAKFGEIDVQPLTRIQKISGPRLQASWVNLPHVTQHDLADITELEAQRQQLKGPARERGISLTPLAFVMKACVAALREFPKVNASLSEDGENLVFKKYCHLGFAADTDQGLMVPVIRDADQKDVYEIASELGELSALAREGKLKADQLQGATFTISSLGGIGGTAFTPIVNAPEVGILGVSRSSIQPVWNGSEFEPRLMLPLSFSYDHRVIDGAQAVRFTTFLAEKLGDVNALLQAIP